MPPRLFRHGELPLVLLSVLHRQPSHGYQLLAELTTIFGSRYSASPGSVYPALETLEKQGLVLGTDAAGRREYAVSETGVSTLAGRRSELVALESRLGVRLLQGDPVDRALDRLSAAVATRSTDADPDAVVRLLDDTADHLRSLPHRSTHRTRLGET